GDMTTVRWAMQGPTPYFAKIIHLFIDMDRMVGKDFEAGLANLKAAAES
ncbi:MAG TPA: polyketide cyclase, partial [Burkholderiales bacterium]